MESVKNKVQIRDNPWSGLVNGFQTMPGRDAMIGLLILFAVFSLLSPHFLSVRNIINILLQGSINAIVSFGMIFVIISGGIDLSLGSIVGLTGIVLGLTLTAGMPILLAVAITMVVGAICGLINGLFITRFKLTPFIVTLGSQGIFRGVAYLLNNGKPVFGMPHRFIQSIAGTQWGIPRPVLIMFAGAVVCHVLLTQTKLGQYARAIGSNEQAAKVCGINVNRYLIWVYTAAGLLATLSSLVVVARLRAAEPIAGMSYELEAVAAVVLGGASLSGGVGSVMGALIGAILISTLKNGLNILGVQAYYQQILIGFVLVAAVILDQARRKQA
jgi:ribose transport system permease protein